MVIHRDQPPRSPSAGGIRLRILQCIALLLTAVVAVQQWRAAQPPHPTPLPLTKLTGQVVDTQGAPQAGLQLTFKAGAGLGKEHRWKSWDATSAADGTFSVSVPPTRITVQSRQRPLRDPGTLAFDLERMPPPHLQIVVRTAAEWPTLSGVVVDEQDRPVAGAEVAVDDYAEATEVTTSEQGTFELPRPAACAASQVRVACRHDRYEWPRNDFFAWGRRDLRLVMRQRVPVQARVVDDQGRDLMVAKIQAQSDDVGRTFVPPVEFENPGTGWRGELWRGIAWFSIELDPKIASSWYAKLPQRAEVAEPTLVATFALPRSATRTVQIVTTDGAPIVGSRVELIMPQGADVSATANTQSCSVSLHPGMPIELDHAVTDARGQVSLTGPAGSALVVRACGPGHLTEVVTAVDLTVAAPLTVATRPGAHAEGRIRADAVVAELLREGNWGLRLIRTVAGTFEDWPMDNPAPVEASGSFVIAGAAAGEWTPLLVQPRQTRLLPFDRCEPLPPLTLSAGPNAPLQFDLSHWNWVDLRGRVVVDGEAVAGQYIQVIGDGEREGPRSQVLVQTDGDGRFQARVRSGSLRVHHGWPACESGLVTVDREHAEHTFAIHTGKLEVTLVDGRGEPQRGRQVHLLSSPGDLGWFPAEADGDGVVHVRLQPQPWVVMFIHEDDFKAALATGDRMLERLRDGRALLGTITVRAGETVRERMTLPAR